MKKAAIILLTLIGMNLSFAEEPGIQFKELYKQANEPIYKEATTPKGTEIYRFTWLRSFHEPMIFKIEVLNENQGSITIKKLSKDEPTKLVENRKLQLNKTQIENLHQLFNATEFWKLPSKDPKKSGFDGAEWNLEIIKDGKHHYTSRWSPLPPYYGWVGTPDGGEKRLSPPLEQQVKHSDEVGLDFLCLYIILMANPNAESIY